MEVVDSGEMVIVEQVAEIVEHLIFAGETELESIDAVVVVGVVGVVVSVEIAAVAIAAVEVVAVEVVAVEVVAVEVVAVAIVVVNFFAEVMVIVVSWMTAMMLN